jgi:hypothetical protein
MARIIERQWQTAGSSASRIGFEVDGWSRYLTVDGRRAYFIGGGCDTCPFLFERLEGANGKVEIEETVAALRTGIASLADPAVDRLGSALPDGEYLTCLLDITVELVRPGRANDYFAQEQVTVWGLNGFWGLPHHPKVPYYRAGRTEGVDDLATLFEFIVPMVPDIWLDPSTVSAYAGKLESGQRPTAVAIAALDVRAPVDWPRPGAEVYGTHWGLTHYLLDGHHKSFAASQVGKPLTLLSFVAPHWGVSSRAQIERIASVLAA